MPQGIGRGSTPAQLKAAYSYIFLVSKNMVVGVTLILTAQDC